MRLARSGPLQCCDYLVLKVSVYLALIVSSRGHEVEGERAASDVSDL